MEIILKKQIIKNNSINKLLISFDKKHGAMELIAKNGNHKISRRIINGDRNEYTTVFQNKSNTDIEIDICLSGDNISKDKVSNLICKEICKIYKDISFKSNDNSITASIATYPPRIKTLPTAVESIIDQVDHLFIYLNNYQEVPSYLLFHKKKDKITYFLDSASKKRAAAKFFWVDKIKGVHLACDDDIEYPKNYVEVMKSHLDNSYMNTIVGVHSVIYQERVVDPIGSRKNVFNFKERLDYKEQVHLLGTGTLCFNTKTLNISGFEDIWNFASSTDEWLACFSKKRNIKMFAVPRKNGWMKSVDGMNFGLHEEKQINQELRLKAKELISSNNPWIQFENNTTQDKKNTILKLFNLFKKSI